MTTAERRRLEAALAASAMIHLMAALWLGAHHMTPLPGVRPAPRVIPVSLLGRPGGGGGARGPEPASAPEVAAPAFTPPPVLPERRPAQRKPARPAVASHPPAATAPATGIPVPSMATEGGTTGGDAGQGTGAGGAGGGDGTGGDGTGGARVAYGSNPKPPYPLALLRLHIEGTVLLEVTVAPDGHPSAVRLQQSSGHAALDDSAVTTVRDRWRFVPARVGGAAVEGTVQVPIRFHAIEDE